MTEGLVHSIETFGAVDGPGIRYIIFLTGCKFRCLYCHNPDSWTNGKLMSSDLIISNALKYKPYWGKFGGITVSGGEPLLQLDFLIDLFTKCKENKINTCIETAGGPFDLKNKKFEQLLSLTDLIIFDIKELDEKKFKKLTGCTQDSSKAFGKFLIDKKFPVWIRYVLVPGLTDSKKDLIQIKDYIKHFNLKKFELLPYHTLGVFKYKELGLNYTLNARQATEKDIKKAYILIK